MPEGDTIYKIAQYLSPLLQGRDFPTVAIRGEPVEGFAKIPVKTVEAKGKHLLVGFQSGLMIRSHLGMYGSWHHFQSRQSWRVTRKTVSLEISDNNESFVCLNAKEVEVLKRWGVRKRILDQRLGPDLIQEPLNTTVLLSRIAQRYAGDEPLVDVLLDQRIATGIGNVYKSEVLFLNGLNPATPVARVTSGQWVSCYETAVDLLTKNLKGGPRVTRFQGTDGRHWVYGRRDQACFNCDEKIRNARMGHHFRSTYWCPTCQSNTRHVL